MSDRRGNWYLITGFILGAVAGLLYSWLINPVHYVGTAPFSMKSDFKNSYRILVASAYASDGDIGRARARLTLLRDPDPAQALAAQAQQILAVGGQQSDARVLAVMAVAIGQLPTSLPTTATAAQLPTRTVTTTRTLAATSPALQVSVTPTLTPPPTQTPGLTSVAYTASPSPTLQPSPDRTITATRQTGTPHPTSTPTPTLGAPFALKERSRVCDQTASQANLQVQINDASGNPVPGVEILVSWQDGQDAFFTGFMPEINAGFATFRLTPELVYSIRLTDGGEPVNDLAAVSCSATAGQTYWGGWYLVFQQP